MQSAAIPPVRKTIEVGTDTEHAFRVFTAHMHQWWPPPCDGGEERTNMLLEPRVGGRWFEQMKSGEERQLGRVLSWQPHTRLLLTWQLRLKEKTFDPNLETEIEITFTSTTPGKTLVAVEHRHLERFGIEAQQAYEAFNSPYAWVGILEAFRDAFWQR